MKTINPRKFKLSLSYAFDGIKYLFSTQNNFRIHLLISFIVILAGFFLRITLLEWVIITFLIGFVWVVESINTVFERLFDLLDDSYNSIVKIGKDVSAAAVLISAVISIIIGILIFLPPIIRLFF